MRRMEETPVCPAEALVWVTGFPAFCALALIVLHTSVVVVSEQ